MSWRYAEIAHTRTAGNALEFHVGPTAPEKFADTGEIGMFLAQRPGTLVAYWSEGAVHDRSGMQFDTSYASVAVVGLGGQLWPVYEGLEHDIWKRYARQAREA